MLIVFFVFLIGILECRVWTYWKWALGLLAWMVASRAVLYLGGPGEDPADHGFITRAIRSMDLDMQQLANLALAVVAAYCVVIAFFVWRLVVAFRRHRRQRADGAVTDASTGRKLLEAAALCVVAVTLATVNVSDLKLHVKDFARDIRGETPQAESQESGPWWQVALARQLQAWAEKTNATLPEQVSPKLTWERVSAERRLIKFHYRMSDGDRSDLPALASFQDLMVPRLCADPKLRALIRNYAVAFRHHILFRNSDTPIIMGGNAVLCRGR